MMAADSCVLYSGSGESLPRNRGPVEKIQVVAQAGAAWTGVHRVRDSTGHLTPYYPYHDSHVSLSYITD